MELPRQIGRYDVVDKIGEGGMGILYLARDTSLGRPVALKVLSVINEELRERFAREARSAASLKHQHIVTIYDIGEDKGRPFMAMEYLDGETMAELIRRGKAMPLARKLELMLELCNGLGYAHRAGLIHRDIKPANVMITTDGSLKILDFGLARLADQGSMGGLTQVGALIGTPHYMSPEQIEGKDLDHRSDIFAVGVVLYEFIGYRKAFPGENWQAVLPKILHTQPRPLREFSDQLDPELEQIIDTAIAKKPADRYAQLSAMANDLRRVLDRVRSSSAEVTVRVDRPPDSPDGGQSRTPSPTPTHRPSSDVIAKRRAEQIRAHLARATAEMEARNFEAAIEQCELALVIDPNDFRVLRVLDDAHRTLEERRVSELLQQAEEQLAHSSLTAAAALLEQAQQLRPEAPEVLRIQKALTDRRLEQERRAENARAARGALERGLASERDEAYEAAVRSANEALMYEPANEEALELKRRASQLLAAQRAQQRERQVEEAIANGRHLAAGRDYEQAFRLLQAFPFPHPAIDQLRDELVAERDAYETNLQEEAEARQRADEDARRQAEEEEIQRAEERARRDGEEEARRLELDAAKRLADAEARRRAEDEARRQAEVGALRQAQAEARRRADEEARRQAEARLREEEEARRRNDEARRATPVPLPPPQVMVPPPLPLPPTVAIERPTSTGSASAATRPPASISSPAPAAKGGQAMPLLVAAAAFVLVVAIGAWWIASRGNGESTEATSTPATATTTPIEVPTTTPSAPPVAPPAEAPALSPNITVNANAPSASSPNGGAPLSAAASPSASPASPAPSSLSASSGAGTTSSPSPAPAPPPVSAPAATAPPVARNTAPPPPVTTPSRGTAAAPSTSVATSAESSPSARTAPPPVSPPPVRAEVPRPAPGIDLGTASALLGTYAQLAGRLDVAALRRVFPRLPPGMAQRIDGLRRTFSECEYRFSNPQVVSSTATSAVVEADSAERCMSRAAQRSLSLPDGRYEFHLVKDASGSWIFEDVLVQ